MNFENIKEQYKTLFDFTLEKENKWSVICPYFKVDGSMVEVYLVKRNNKFYLTDDAFTISNLSCYVDVDCEDCTNVIKELCDRFKKNTLKGFSLNLSFFV